MLIGQAFLGADVNVANDTACCLCAPLGDRGVARHAGRGHGAVEFAVSLAERLRSALMEQVLLCDYAEGVAERCAMDLGCLPLAEEASRHLETSAWMAPAADGACAGSVSWTNITAALAGLSATCDMVMAAYGFVAADRAAWLHAAQDSVLLNVAVALDREGREELLKALRAASMLRPGFVEEALRREDIALVIASLSELAGVDAGHLMAVVQRMRRWDLRRCIQASRTPTHLSIRVRTLALTRA